MVESQIGKFVNVYYPYLDIFRVPFIASVLIATELQNIHFNILFIIGRRLIVRVR